MAITAPVIGRIIGTPTYHHSSSYGNAAYQFVVLTQGGTDAEVLVTAANAQIGYAIRNPEYREREHKFIRDGRGKVIGATPSPYTLDDLVKATSK